jgi:hypothetical protein
MAGDDDTMPIANTAEELREATVGIRGGDGIFHGGPSM